MTREETESLHKLKRKAKLDNMQANEILNNPFDYGTNDLFWAIRVEEYAMEDEWNRRHGR